MYTQIYQHIGCFVSAEQILTRLAFSTRVNVFLKAMYIPEAYFNKTSLDGHFATAGKQMRASVAAGAGENDAFDAASMFKARTSEKATGTVCVCMCMYMHLIYIFMCVHVHVHIYISGCRELLYSFRAELR